MVAHCAMVQGAGLEPAISKLSVWGLTNLATLTYGCFVAEAPEREFVFVHSEDTRIKAHRAYLFCLYTAHSVDGRRSVLLLRTSMHQFVYLI